MPLCQLRQPTEGALAKKREPSPRPLDFHPVVIIAWMRPNKSKKAYALIGYNCHVQRPWLGRFGRGGCSNPGRQRAGLKATVTQAGCRVGDHRVTMATSAVSCERFRERNSKALGCGATSLETSSHPWLLAGATLGLLPIVNSLPYPPPPYPSPFLSRSQG